MVASRLYAIIDRETLERRGVGVGEMARELREAGVTLLQYRDKVGGPRQILQACDAIETAFAGTHAKLVLNDRADLAALRGWGVHVGQTDLAVSDAADLVATVGVSTHTLEQVRIAEDGAARYVAIGPVFATSTKTNAEPVVGLEGVRQARSLTTKPLVAIGGITLENCRSVVESGAETVAVISGLFVAGRSVREVAEDFLRVLG